MLTVFNERTITAESSKIAEAYLKVKYASVGNKQGDISLAPVPFGRQGAAVVKREER